jgi:YVTN family beta-propeller protein
VPAPQAITFTSTPPSPASVGASYAVAATGGESGNPVVFTTLNGPCSMNGLVVRFVAVGTCTITANQAGNASYRAAPSVDQTFIVEPGKESFAYVANLGSDNVSVIRTSDNTVTATVPVGHWPFGVALTPDGGHIYVANILSNNVSVIRTSDNTVTATVLVGGGPHGVAVRPGGAFAYVANHNGTTVSVLRTSDNTVTATVPVGNNPYGLAFTPNGDFLYVTNTNSANVSVIRTSDNTVTGTVAVGASPRGAAVTPDGAHLYVMNQVSDNVSVIRTSDNTVTTTVSVGNGPFGLDVTPDGAYVYVANIFGNTVSVIRTSDNTVTATLPVGPSPVGVAATPDGAHIYVANQDANNLSVIRTADNTITGTVAVGSGPRILTVGFVPAPQAINRVPAADPAGPYAGGEGVALTFDGSASSDPDGDELTYSWDFGDGATATGASPAHAYADNGTYTVTLKVTDAGGLTSTATSTAVIGNLPPAATFVAPATGLENTKVIVALTEVSDPGSADVVQYAFDCGDGKGYGALTATNNRPCVPADNGALAVKGKVQDDDGGWTEYMGSIVVANVAPTATFTYPTKRVPEGSSFSMALTKPVDAAADLPSLSYTMYCPSAPLQTGASVTCGAGNNNLGNAAKTVFGQITDKDQGASTYSGNVLVTNVEPTLQVLTVANGNRSYSVSVWVSDPMGVQDMEQYCVTNGFSTTCGTAFYATVNWGDTSGLWVFSPSQAAQRTISHTYSQAGSYTVTVTARDKDGATVKTTGRLTVK